MVGSATGFYLSLSWIHVSVLVSQCNGPSMLPTVNDPDWYVLRVGWTLPDFQILIPALSVIWYDVLL